MKPAAHNLYQSLLAVVAIAVFFSNVSHYAYYRGWGASFLTPKMWVLGFVVLAAPLIVSRLFAWDLRAWPILLWCAGYVAVSVVWFFAASDSETAWQELRLRAQTVMVLVAMVVVFADERAVRWARWTVAACVAMAVCFNVLELFNPMLFSYSFGRSAGLYLNANQSGLALVAGMIFSVTLLKPAYRGLFIVLVVVGLLTTASRQASLGFCAAVGVSLFWGDVKLRQIATAGMLAGALAIILLLPRLDALMTYIGSVGLDRLIEERLTWLTDPTLDESPYEENTHSRLDAAALAWDRFSEHPFWGGGVGTHLAMSGANDDRTLSVGSHNMYLAYMVDHGVLGMVVFPGAILAAVWGARGEAQRLGMGFTAALLIIGMFSHNMLVDSFTLALMALMAAMTGLSRAGEAPAGVRSAMRPSAGFDRPEYSLVHPMSR